jgi:hypothetical protein
MLVQQLDTVVAAAAKVINGQTDSLAGLRREIETLRGQLGSAGPASPGSASKGQKGESSGGAPKGGEAKGVKDDGKKTESKGKEPPRKVTYRPPIEQFTTKTPIRFVCQNDRVSVLPLDAAFEARLQAFISAERIGQGQSKLFEFDLPKCDFLMRGVADKTTAQIEAVPKPGRPGETGDEIRKPGSLFRETLESTPGCSPKTHCVLFYVWPDSFDVYRKARSLVWETRVGGARYSEGWKAMLPAERIQFVRQPGRGGATPVQPY